MTASKPAIRPTPEQVAAADPGVSAWVGANAGSGKTRVLTQRVARLLLGGARPERILCLTYTKAAAAEMQTRLFRMLGDWAMAPDEALAAELAGLEGAEAVPSDPDRLARARTLFAAALETPGGLRIQTIHAFCDALLRRFPLEARVSPRFEVLDDRQQALMLRAILSDMAAEAEAGGNPAFDLVAARLNDGAIADLAAAAMAVREGFPEGAVADRIAAHLGADALRTPAALAAARLARLDWDRLTAHEAVQRGVGKATGAKVADAIAGASALGDRDPEAAATLLLAAFMTTDGARRSRKNFPVQAVLAADPDAEPLTEAMLDWAEETAEAFRAAEAGARAADLDAFARSFLARYESAKAARGLLDFDDLVGRTRDLLTRSDLAAWALYKMDRGIDHILVDEAQDTAPGQWRVIRAVTEEFFAGESARERGRSLFVVGDEKQSIYSFQGAEPRAFGETRHALGQWLDAMGRRLERPDLHTSFRSASGILEFVDAVFQGEAAGGLTVDGDAVIHRAHRAEDVARIDLWPLVQPEAREEDSDWWEPVDRVPPGAPKLRLARILGDEISRMIAEDHRPPRAGKAPRRVRPGDILVLVSKRDILATALIRRLKTLGVPVAGSDRLTLAGELAVRDLMALVKVAIAPGDDLSLAALLRSPVFGLGEEELFALAHGRGPARLIDRLRASPEHAHAAAVLDDMAARADYLRPYEFLQRALIRHGARQRLIARLGQEAEDPIDELLEQALAFEARETPSLAGFVAWIEAGEIQVKRETAGGEDKVRIMTVHGAKGLEAPIVILPDTMSGPNRGGTRPRLIRASGGGNAPPLVCWAGAKADEPRPVRDAIEAAEAREDDERKRLLYVALTRAEDWLILCGAGDADRSEGKWYDLIRAGAGRIEGWRERPGPAGLAGPVRRLETGRDAWIEAGAAEVAPMDEAPGAAERRPAPPGWLAPARAEARTGTLAPSDLAPHETVGGAGLGRDSALLYGAAVHLVLERLAGAEAARRDQLARRLIAAALPDLDPALAEPAIAEAGRVLAAPFADRVFGAESLAEVAIAANLPGAGRILGRIDRLIDEDGRLMAVDFKTDALPPAEAASVRPAYLAQLGAYRAGLARAFPGRPVGTAILWTARPSLMALPDALVDAALAAALSSLDSAS